MKKLVIVRHGSYGRDLCLDEFGKAQIASISKQLQEHVGESVVKILTSTAPRAEGSARILSEGFGVDFESHSILWSDYDHREDYDGTLVLVQEKGADVDILIIVTHLEYGESFPSFYAESELDDWSGSISGRGIQKGQALIIDCENKSMIKLSPAW